MLEWYDRITIILFIHCLITLSINQMNVYTIIEFQVNLISTRLEVHLFVKTLDWLLDKMDGLIDEVCTDAHISISKLISKYF